MVRLDKKLYGQFSMTVPLNFVTLRIQIKKKNYINTAKITLIMTVILALYTF